MKAKRVGIAMSGGVDSTACALLLREHHEIEGFFMHLAQPDFAKQEKRVESVAKRLGIRLNIIDLRYEFEQRVLDYFSSSYLAGSTPNPCVICNREIKFGLFMENILNRGMDKMATGHYARIVKDGGLYRLYRGADPKKDQSYFLSRLNQLQLSHILFPLAETVKESTYMFVEKHGFDDFRGLESQDICFLGDKGIGPFLDRCSPKEDNQGPILSTSGELLGSHRGLFHYTVGQRKGLGVSSDTPLYITGLNRKNNSVTVGENLELFKNNIEIKALHWLAGAPPRLDKDYTVRIRYSHRGALANLTLDKEDRAKILFMEPQRAIAPGQFAVIYDDKELLGSGVIT